MFLVTHSDGRVFVTKSSVTDANRNLPILVHRYSRLGFRLSLVLCFFCTELDEGTNNGSSPRAKGLDIRSRAAVAFLEAWSFCFDG